MKANSYGRPLFEIPARTDKIVATLSRYYGKNENHLLQRLLSESPYEIEENVEFDSIDGGVYGHSITFYVAPEIYDEMIEFVRDYELNIKEWLNKISKVRNEFYSEVFIEPSDDEISLDKGIQLKKEEGIKISNYSTAQADNVSIWKPGYFRLFISHKAEYKEETANIKTALEYYGICSFVAHEDIEPTREWQNEIEKALLSMDAILALMTADFSKSQWTDQELGVAIGRQLPIIPVNIGSNPYGFVGKYQALKGFGKDHRDLAKEIYNLLWSKPSINTKIIQSLVTQFEKARSFSHANDLMDYLEKIEETTPDMIERLEKAPDSNTQVKGSFEVDARLPPLIAKLKKGI